MENPMPTQPSQVTGMEPAQSVSPKPENKMLKALVYFVIALLVVGAAGGAYYYFTQKPQTQKVMEPNPPSLKVNTLQGKSVETGFYVFDETDISNAQADAVLENSSRGVNNFYSQTQMTVEEIIDHIVPTHGLKLLFAFYTDIPACANYWVYPQGPYQETCTIADPAQFEVPAYRAFSIITNKDFQYWGLNKATTPADELSYTLTTDSQSGWVLLPMPSEVTDGDTLTNILDEIFEERYDRVFVQTAQNTFEEGAEKFDPAKGVFVWLRIQPKAVEQVIPNIPAIPNIPLVNLQENLNLTENLQIENGPIIQPNIFVDLGDTPAGATPAGATIPAGATPAGATIPAGATPA